MNTTNSKQHYVSPGDVIVDPMDGETRTIDRIEEFTVFFMDGGVMGVREAEKALFYGQIKKS